MVTRSARHFHGPVSSSAAFLDALDFKHRHSRQLFDLYSARKLRRATFESLMWKTRSMDKFVTRLLHGYGRDAHGRVVPSTIVAFGAAQFPTSAVGQVSGPLATTARKISKQVDTIYVDEFRTSKVHARCKNEMEAKKIPGVCARTQVRTRSVEVALVPNLSHILQS